ncbi:MAG: D-erythronate dehydrogenase [Burkholderiaceae bacterium]
MNILIIGAAGMVGRKLAERLLVDGKLGGQSIDAIEMVDIVTPAVPEVPAGSPAASIKFTTGVADLSATGTATKLVASQPDVIFHLAAIVSGEAEADFEKGYRINLDGTRDLFEAIRLQGGEQYAPRIVFTSSIAVFGAPFPAKIPDDYHLTPLTSYGTQKAIGELLLADYSRRGIFDGVGIRLPTVCIRPGKPNAAASGFFSGILREPINGIEAVLPVVDTVRHWFASPRSAIDFCIHAATIDGQKIGPRRNLSMPGLSATVAEQIDSLGRVVGADAVKLIKRKDDPTIQSIVAGWPTDFDTSRALELGFKSETSFDDIIKVYLEDEMSGA